MWSKIKTNSLLFQTLFSPQIAHLSCCSCFICLRKHPLIVVPIPNPMSPVSSQCVIFSFLRFFRIQSWQNPDLFFLFIYFPHNLHCSSFVFFFFLGLHLESPKLSVGGWPKWISQCPQWPIKDWLFSNSLPHSHLYIISPSFIYLPVLPGRIFDCFHKYIMKRLKNFFTFVFLIQHYFWLIVKTIAYI